MIPHETSKRLEYSRTQAKGILVQNNTQSFSNTLRSRGSIPYDVCHRLRQRKCFTISSRCQQVVGKSASLSAHVSSLWQKKECTAISSRRQQGVGKSASISVHVSSCGKESASLSAHVVEKRVPHYQFTSSAGCGKVSASLSVHFVRLCQREYVTISSRRQQVVAKRVQVVAKRVRHYQCTSSGCGKEST